MTTTTIGRMFAASVVLAALSLTGCSVQQPVPLSVSVFQYRSDLAIRQVQIEVRNRGSVDIMVTAAAFSSDWFVGSRSSRTVPSSVPAGSTIDFPVLLRGARCAARKPAPVATIRYRTSDGTTGSTTVIPTLPFQTITALHAEDCGLLEFEKVATIVPASALRFARVGDTQHVLIDFTVTPTGAPGRVIVLSSQDTPLLSQPEGELRPINLAVSAASTAAVITLDFVPSRCDAHVIGEDKVGTIIPFRVDAGPYRSAVLMIAVPKPVKNQLLDWVGRYCGL